VLAMLVGHPRGRHPPQRTYQDQERSSAVPLHDVPTAVSNGAAPPPREKGGNVASGFTCPNCHGSVWELEEGGLPRIECRVGHAFSVDAFLGEQAIAHPCRGPANYLTSGGRANQAIPGQ